MQILTNKNKNLLLLDLSYNRYRIIIKSSINV